MAWLQTLSLLGLFRPGSICQTLQPRCAMFSRRWCSRFWRPGPGGAIEPRLLRHWLRGCLLEALALGDADLLATCAKAWNLYGP